MSKETGEPVDEVRARRFVLVDDAGEPQATLEMDEGRPKFRLLSEGKPAVGVIGGVERGFVLFDRFERPRAGIVIGPDGNPSLTLRSEDNSYGISASVDAAGANLFVEGPGGDQSTLTRIFSAGGVSGVAVSAKESGEEAVTLAMTKDQGPALTFSAKDGTVRMVVGLGSEGVETLATAAADGSGVGIGRTEQGLPLINVRGPDGKVRWGVALQPDGTPLLSMIDGNGRGRALFSQNADGATLLTFQDSAERTVLAVGVGENDVPDLVLQDGAPRVRLQVINDQAMVALSDQQGRMRCLIAVLPDGKPWVWFYNEKGETVKSIDGSSWL